MGPGVRRARRDVLRRAQPVVCEDNELHRDKEDPVDRGFAIEPAEGSPWAHRTEPALEERRIGRRLALGIFGVSALGVMFGARLERAVARLLGPFGDADGTGLSALLPTGRFRIYSVTGSLPARTRHAYRLRLDGLVDRPLDLTYDDILRFAPSTLVRDFQCVTGWRVEQVPWKGVPLSALLDAAGVRPDAAALRFVSFDGEYTESLTLEQARRDDVLVAYELEGRPLSRAHGGPVRLYIAPMYGYKSLKWLERIEVVDGVEPGYWEVRGYDVDAWVGRSNGRDDDAT